MTLDDSLRGVMEYCSKIGYNMEHFGAVRTVYKRSELFYEKEIEPRPISQREALQWWVRVATYAAPIARDFAKKEIMRNDLASRLRMGGAL